MFQGSQQGIYLDWVRSDGKDMPVSKENRDGVLYIRNVQPEAAGEYSCIGLSSTSGTELFSAATRLEVVGNSPSNNQPFNPFLFLLLLH